MTGFCVTSCLSHSLLGQVALLPGLRSYSYQIILPQQSGSWNCCFIHRYLCWQFINLFLLSGHGPRAGLNVLPKRLVITVLVNMQPKDFLNLPSSRWSAFHQHVCFYKLEPTHCVTSLAYIQCFPVRTCYIRVTATIRFWMTCDPLLKVNISFVWRNVSWSRSISQAGHGNR